MTKPVISVRGLGKKYKLGATLSHNTLRDYITHGVKSLWGKIHGKDSISAVLPIHGTMTSSQGNDTFWALKDINFDVEQGEVVGIIGRNGAGKSTLLKILSEITEPTEGEIRIRGRVASLLEVGTGFHPELSGRENIYLNGAILGMTKDEIRRKFDEIVAFAEVERFLDTPVKRYSSGMHVRLAFAVAAHLEPEILLVDEVLAVGDSDFQKKCLGKMKDVSSHGRTVLFVSHNMGMIGELCQSCILIEEGKIKTSGKPEQVIFEYFSNTSHLTRWSFRGGLAHDVLIEEIIINDNAGSSFVQVKPSEDIEIKVRGVCKQDIPDMKIAITISIHGMRVATLWDTEDFCPLRKGEFESKVTIPRYLLHPGEYIVGVGGDRQKVGYWFYGDNLVQMKIAEEWDENCKKNQRAIINFRKGQSKGVRVMK